MEIKKEIKRPERVEEVEEPEKTKEEENKPVTNGEVFLIQDKQRGVQVELHSSLFPVNYLCGMGGDIFNRLIKQKKLIGSKRTYFG